MAAVVGKDSDSGVDEADKVSGESIVAVAVTVIFAGELVVMVAVATALATSVPSEVAFAVTLIDIGDVWHNGLGYIGRYGPQGEPQG